MRPLHPLTALLLDWYDLNARPLPWREDPEPYATWLSEVILQQTRVDQGTAYWKRFMAAFPTVQDLAAADTDAVMAIWKGLGYYSRARNLHKAAHIIAEERAGKLPQNATDWASLPGIGPYTAAAISSICFDEAVPVVDGNVQRVVSRLFDIEDAVDRKKGKAAVDTACQALIDTRNPGKSNQAWMELGALVCAPRSPRCGECPVAEGCLARQRGTVLDRPVKQPKKAPQAVDVVFSVHLRTGPSGDQQWWVERRPESGIWSQLESFPCTMDMRAPGAEEVKGAVPDRPERFGPVAHILTHRKMTAWFEVATDAAPPSNGGRWVDCMEGSANWPRLIDKVLPELRGWIGKK